MGWLEYSATEWKNGKVDRKAELIKEFNQDTETAKFEVLQCSMHGSVGYLAVRITDKNSGENQVMAYVCLTGVEDRYFSYKEMSETMGPYYFDCPKSILKLLTPTENPYALNWRKECWARHEADSLYNQLRKAKVGSKLKMTYTFDTMYGKVGDEVIIQKGSYQTRKRTMYQWLTIGVGRMYRVPTDMIRANKVEWIEYIV